MPACGHHASKAAAHDDQPIRGRCPPASLAIFNLYPNNINKDKDKVQGKDKDKTLTAYGLSNSLSYASLGDNICCKVLGLKTGGWLLSYPETSCARAGAGGGGGHAACARAHRAHAPPSARLISPRTHTPVGHPSSNSEHLHRKWGDAYTESIVMWSAVCVCFSRLLIPGSCRPGSTEECAGKVENEI